MAVGEQHMSAGNSACV